ncbi:MAG: hypothetical protein JST46_15700 [Bacteroidetes bacterium]|nr:hypothetical protein [Bacteroidota bacterium]
MKRTFLFALLLTVGSAAKACPYCGCGNSNFWIGALPTFSNGFVGFRHSYTYFKTDSGSQYSRDYFHTTEVWGGYKHGKWQAMVFVPYISIHKTSDDGVTDQSGVGDITILFNYEVFSKTTAVTDGKPYFANMIYIGGGIKLPTGKSNVNVSDPDFTVGDFTNTPGTGSTDFLLNLNHNLFFGSNGLVTNVAYKINTENSQQYRYGNRFYFNTSYFHTWPAGEVNFSPSLGVNMVFNSGNYFQGQEVLYSAGYLLNGMAGLNVQWKKVGLILNGFMPLSQNLFEGLTVAKARWQAAVTYSF